ncbi:cAMP-dependent protein kinase regulatory subunit [Hypsizygus marmoreus]|uniref:cAMP-dependent protein kinase regulatory subunit n=1 Tax=Hypsizygus marmoreus TaxID=39966 RepID=A0A369JT35_HYPMA|nr:cAMP-dependent protein kinase regulatory subunit [Hypsizygus marmoreus]
MSTFDNLVKDLTRDVHRVQPKDALQFCANWFQSRLEEQRARTRDVLSSQRRSFAVDLPSDIYIDAPVNATEAASSSQYFPTPSQRSSLRDSIAQSPFGMLNVPGNALLSDDDAPSPFNFDRRELPPTSPLTTANPFAGFDPATPTSHNPGDYLHPPTSTIFARRTSVSAESIIVDSSADEQLPVYPKTDEQIRRIKASIANNFIFRDLDEEQETGVLNAMQELKVGRNEVVIRQGDVGEYFYVVEDGLLNCYIRPEPLPPTWLTESHSSKTLNPEDMFIQPGYHPEFGRQVAECKPGRSFGELALMYGHPRAATVLSIEPSTLWSLDRITFRTIILKAAHRRRTMYEQFLSTVTLLSSLDAPERSKIADALVSKVYQDGEAVVRQGEMGDTFFFVEEGEAVVTKLQRSDEGDVQEITVGHLVKGDYFGELSLLRAAPRAATVSAVHRDNPAQHKLKVAALDAPAFTRLLGPLREIMERKAGERY